ncbi:MAG: hypothetical protein IJ489_01900 [Clostridia bacterium]|nr:hypothetical protein [Clostridia bacterium]
MISFLAKVYPFILLAICILAVPLSARIKKSEEEQKNTVRLMRLPIFIGVGTGIFMAVVLMLIAFFDVGAGVYIAFAVFSLLPLFLISSFFTFHIEYDKDGFTHRNALGIKRRYRYTDVTGISGGHGDITIYANGHHIRIDALADRHNFIAFVKKQYRKNNQGNALPKKKPKTDIFNGNVHNPGEFIFVYALMYVFLIGMFIFVFVVSQPTKVEDLTYQTVSFDRYVIEKDEHSDDLCLYAGDIEYRMNSYENYLKNANHLLSLCNGKTVFEVGVTGDKTCYHIEMLATKDGVPYLTLEETNRIEKESMLGIILIFGVIFVIWTAVVVLSVIIGRNPRKYPKWLVHAFFKPSYINR